MIRKPREHSLCWEKGQGKGFVVRIAAIKVKFYGLKKIRQQLEPEAMGNGNITSSGDHRVTGEVK